jgi:hypothetical protein
MAASRLWLLGAGYRGALRQVTQCARRFGDGEAWSFASRNGHD